jgi:hypothetical protein
MICVWKIGNDVRGSGRGASWGNIPEFSLRNRWNPQITPVTASCVRTEIWTQTVQNTKKAWYWLDGDVWDLWCQRVVLLTLRATRKKVHSGAQFSAQAFQCHIQTRLLPFPFEATSNYSVGLYKTQCVFVYIREISFVTSHVLLSRDVLCHLKYLHFKSFSNPEKITKVLGRSYVLQSVWWG